MHERGSQQKPGAIVLCGGRSRRMGQPKADLPFGSSTLLGTIVATVASVCQPLIAVAAAGQSLPDMPAGVEVVRDAEAYPGPMMALAAGLAALRGRVRIAAVVSCDVPLLTPAFLLRIVDRLELSGADAAVPRLDGRWQPLVAAYRIEVLPRIEQFLATGQRRLLDLVEALNVEPMDVTEQADRDGLVNVNDPETYQQAARLAQIRRPVL